jgi:AraC-like DNA-binding protein
MKTSLAKTLARKKSLADLLQQVADLRLSTWCIEDVAGRLVFGKPPGAAMYEYPVRVGNEMAGRVKSENPGAASFIAALLENWLRQEDEKKQLGAETLHLYREINLIFSFSEKLSATLSVEAIARLSLQEAGQIIRFDCGAVYMWHENTGKAQLLAQSDNRFSEKINPVFFQKIVNSGKSEIIAAPADAAQMILYTSLRLGQRVLGAIVLQGASFSAADLKLLATLGFQAAAALENSVRHERATAQALKEQREKLTLEMALKNPFFKELMAVVESGCSDPAFSVETLADKLHRSVSQLQRKIGAMTELTPVQIIRDVRLARAKELLRTTELSVSEVAFRVGFNDPSYFTRLFVREMNCTPSEWRDKPR